MGRFKDMNSFTGELRVMQKLTEYEFGVELWIMRDGVNDNGWDFRNVDKYYQTFLGTPILCAYVAGQIGDGHNMREKLNLETGETYYSFTDGTAERIVGAISDDPRDLTLKKRDGHIWVVAKGRLWSFYAPELVDKIVRTGRMDVSAETEVKEAVKDGNIEIYNVWAGLGVTILGDRVEPAIPGARIAALTAMQDEFKSLKLRAASLSNKNKSQNQKKTHKGVKGQMNKQAMARLAPKFEGYKIVGLSDDGMRVALVDEKGCAFSYVFNAEDKGEVISAKIEPATLSAVYSFGGESQDVFVDVADIIDFVAANAKTVNMETEALIHQLEEAQSLIQTMQAEEHDRRISSVKDALKKTLAEINSVSEEDDMSMECSAIEADAETYASMETDGKFCGDVEACKVLKAKWAEKTLAREMNKKKAFAWGDVHDAGAVDNGGIDGMLAFING